MGQKQRIFSLSLKRKYQEEYFIDNFGNVYEMVDSNRVKQVTNVLINSVGDALPKFKFWHKVKKRWLENEHYLVNLAGTVLEKANDEQFDWADDVLSCQYSGYHGLYEGDIIQFNRKEYVRQEQGIVVIDEVDKSFRIGILYSPETLEFHEVEGVRRLKFTLED